MRMRHLPLVGSGSTAQVHDNKNGTLSKLAKVKDGEFADVVWIKYVIKNQQNPFIPKVRNVKLMKTIHGAFRLKYSIEKLRVAEHLSDGDDFLPSDIIEKLKPWFNQDIKTNGQLEECLNSLQSIKDPQLENVVEFLLSVCRDSQGEIMWDLHSGNYGFRKDNQLVIFDPLYQDN